MSHLPLQHKIHFIPHLSSMFSFLNYLWLQNTVLFSTQHTIKKSKYFNNVWLDGVAWAEKNTLDSSTLISHSSYSLRYLVEKVGERVTIHTASCNNVYWYVVTQSELQRGWTTHEKGSVFSWLWKDFLRSATHYGRLPGDKGLQYSLKAPEREVLFYCFYCLLLGRRRHEEGEKQLFLEAGSEYNPLCPFQINKL